MSGWSLPPIRRVLPTVVLVALFLMLASMVRSGPLGADEILGTILAGYHTNAFTVINRVASVQVWTVLVLVVGSVLWVVRRRRTAAVLVAGSLASEVLALSAKALVQRPRPPGAELADIVATSSFPSGHAMRVMVALALLVALLVWQHPTYRLPAVVSLFMVLLGVGVARVAVGDHWPSDVLGGYILAGTWVTVVLIGMRSNVPRSSSDRP